MATCAPVTPAPSASLGSTSTAISARCEIAALPTSTMPGMSLTAARMSSAAILTAFGSSPVTETFSAEYMSSPPVPATDVTALSIAPSRSRASAETASRSASGCSVTVMDAPRTPWPEKRRPREKMSWSAPAPRLMEVLYTSTPGKAAMIRSASRAFSIARSGVEISGGREMSAENCFSPPWDMKAVGMTVARPRLPTNRTAAITSVIARCARAQRSTGV